MERHFERELEALKEQLLLMGGRAESIVLKSVEALRRLDTGLAQEVFADDRVIDRMEIDIEERCVRLLALQQPMARDLRFITAALKINNDLERVGDHAVNIAGSVERLADQPLLKPLVDIPRMAGLASGMLAEALDLFVRRDAEGARRLCARDDEVDALNRQVFRELVSFMVEDPATITRAMELVLVARNLERVADLATNVAEEVVFIAEARVIKHHAEEAGPGGRLRPVLRGAPRRAPGAPRKRSGHLLAKVAALVSRPAGAGRPTLPVQRLQRAPGRRRGRDHRGRADDGGAVRGQVGDPHVHALHLEAPLHVARRVVDGGQRHGEGARRGQGTRGDLNEDQSAAKSLTNATATCADVRVLLSTKPWKVTFWPARLPSSTCAYRLASMMCWPTAPGPPDGRYQYGSGSPMQFGPRVTSLPDQTAVRSAGPHTASPTGSCRRDRARSCTR